MDKFDEERKTMDKFDGERIELLESRVNCLEDQLAMTLTTVKDLVDIVKALRTLSRS